MDGVVGGGGGAGEGGLSIVGVPLEQEKELQQRTALGLPVI